MQASLIINNGDITIRPLLTTDISYYVSLFQLAKNERIGFIKKCKKAVKEHKEDDPNLLFAVLYKGEVVGAIVTQCYNCDAVVVVDIPREKSLVEKVRETFEKLCKNTQIYDNIIFGKQLYNATIDVRGEKKIACYQSKTTSV